MPRDLTTLLADVLRHNVDVVHCRNQGGGAVPVRYVDDLTSSVAELVGALAALPGPWQPACDACGNTTPGEVVRIGSENAVSGIVDMCTDSFQCDRNLERPVGDGR